MIQQILAIWSLVSQPFLSPACLLVVSPAQSCLTLCDPMDYSPPGSFVHEILQARILEWISIPFSRGSSWSRDWILGVLPCRQVLFCLSHQGSSDGFSWSCGIKKVDLKKTASPFSSHMFLCPILLHVCSQQQVWIAPGGRTVQHQPHVFLALMGKQGYWTRTLRFIYSAFCFLFLVRTQMT